MSTLTLPTLISCDEAGFTGNNMLDSDQPLFSYASHDLTLQEAQELLAAARSKHPVQMSELKAAKLLKTARGRQLLLHVLDAVQGRYILTVYNKRLALACKLFEYIFEPVLQKNNALFYEHNLHRFVGMALFIQMHQQPMASLAVEFEKFMRSLDPADAPAFFSQEYSPHPTPVVSEVLRFSNGNNFLIAEAVKSLVTTGETARWVLDLSVSAVFSHLARWGTKHPLLSVVCDDSKPLRALSDSFDVMINRPEQISFDAFGKSHPITWNMSGKVMFSPSHLHAGVELADLLAGVANAMPSAATNAELRPLCQRAAMHLNEQCILPDADYIDLSNPAVEANAVVLEELARRADDGDDPLWQMGSFYERVKVAVTERRTEQLIAG